MSAFGLKEPTHEELAAVKVTDMEDISALMKEELTFDKSELGKLIKVRQSKFTDSQRVVYKTAMDAVETSGLLYLFIDARGGTGKTFVMNAYLLQ